MSKTASFSERDTLSRFLLERSGIRGVLVRQTDTWAAIRERVPYPPEVATLLGETAVAAALFTGHAKVDGRLSIQLRGTAHLRTLFAECTAAGTLRGIASYTEPLPSPLGPRAFGAGSVLAITIENVPPGAREPQRYQGLVGLDADRLADAFEAYFDQSEQLPTRLRLAVGERSAAGLMLQQLPGAHGDDDGWTRCSALFDTLADDELVNLSADTLLWRLFHEEGVRVLGERPLRFACSCSRDRVAGVLVSLGHREALAAVEQGNAEITCEFCGQLYRFGRGEIESLFVHAERAAPAPEGLH